MGLRLNRVAWAWAILLGIGLLVGAAEEASPSGQWMCEIRSGGWRSPMGVPVAVLDLASDGTFSLKVGRAGAIGSWRRQPAGITFEPTTSSVSWLASGRTARWRMRMLGDLRMLTEMDPTASAVPAPATRPADVEVDRLLVWTRIPPFIKGHRDHREIVGGWSGSGGVFTFQETGAATIRAMGQMVAGEWSQVGRQLSVRSAGSPVLGATTRPVSSDGRNSEAVLELVCVDRATLVLAAKLGPQVYFRSDVILPSRVPAMKASTRPSDPIARRKMEAGIVGAAKLAGYWRADDVGAVFELKENGEFTMIMTARGTGGRASGKWRQNGKELMLETASSTIPGATPGTETFEVLTLTDRELVLKNPQAQHPRNNFFFTRTAAFKAGSHDKAGIVGSWYDPGRHVALIVAENGTAVVPEGGRYRVWEWSQFGDDLHLLYPGLKTIPAGAGVDRDQYERHVRVFGLEGDALALELPDEYGRREGRILVRLK